MRAAHEHRFVTEMERSTFGGDGAVRWAVCECGLRKRERALDGRLYEVSFKVPGQPWWIDPGAVLAAQLPVILCEHHARHLSVFGDQCPACGGLGVVALDGRRLSWRS